MSDATPTSPAIDQEDDTAPVELLLHVSSIEGGVDLLGMLGLSDEFRKRCKRIRITFT